MAVLIDTNVLLAYLFVRDAKHVLAKKAMESTKGKSNRIVPAPVLQELFHMAVARINYERAIIIMEYVQNGAFEIVPLIYEDRQRMTQIMRQYASAAFDYTDAAIMALSERLNITQVYTFDQRDFRIFRPQPAPFLELLP